VGRIAPVPMAARRANKDPAALLADIADEIGRQTGEKPTIGEPTPVSPEEAKAKREVLKAIILELHDGKPPAELKERFDLLLQDVGPMEIGRMENELIAEGMPAEEVRRLCDLHVDVFKPALEHLPTLQVPPGHPVHTLMAENRAFERICRGLTEELSALRVGGDLEGPKAGLLVQLGELAEVEKHYVRKENLLFPLLEKNGVSGPSQVMWAVHDAIRALLKSVRAAVESGDPKAAGTEGPKLTQAIVDMIFKEENILFPMLLELVTDAEWQAVRDAEGEVGYAFVSPGNDWEPSQGEAAPATPHAHALSKLALETGLLSLEQVNLVLNHLPVELSFIDENDEVRFYSGGDTRIFPRSPQVIGRKVQNCHPPKSVHVVNRILEAFKAGTKDSAEFWIELQGMFLHIRYFAVRDGQQRYRGTLEVTQDVTAIRKLEGQRRLLDWT